MCLPWNHKWGEWREVTHLMAMMLANKFLVDGSYRINPAPTAVKR